ncbi:MAG TPA: amidohydrolase family protein [Alphaproteobacteria bacterium]
MAPQDTRPRLKAPPGACDTHMHFYDDRFPMAPTALLKPPPATVPEYRRLQQRLGLSRTVIVQPSTYGTDNSCTLEAMAALGANARGVAVVDTSVTNAEMERLTKAGMRGIRFHMLKGGALPWDILETMAARAHEFGWHIQLQLDGRELPEREATLKRLPGTLVIDHVGKFLEPVPVDHPGFRVLARLVEGGRTWVKLSAPYEVSKKGPPYYDDVGALAKALIKLAPDRMVWASNWPHPSVPKDKAPDDAVLLDTLLDWAPDDKSRNRILADNPAKLYGFGPA